MKHSICAAIAALALSATLSAEAAGLKPVGEILMPGAVLDSFDISFVEQATGQLFIADRSNKSVDILDAKTGRYVTRVTGFVGVGPTGNTSGPNGVVSVYGGREVWAGDGDSSIKVVDVGQGRITDTISTGGKKRADEVAWDPKNEVFIVANDADEPPFITLISTRPGHKIIAKLVMERATDGIEQPQYNPGDGLFYIDIPELDHQKTKGGLAVIDPKTGRLVKIIPVDNCIPHGLTKGPGSQLFVGCNAGTERNKLPAQLAVVDTKLGKVTAVIAGAGGSDESWANNNIGQWYAATSNFTGGPALTVVDSKTNKVIQRVPTSVQAHSVAASIYNNYVFVPTTAKNGSCGGCILVLAPQ